MALALVPEAKRRPMLAFAESLSETMFKFTNLVMYARRSASLERSLTRLAIWDWESSCRF